MMIISMHLHNKKTSKRLKISLAYSLQRQASRQTVCENKQHLQKRHDKELGMSRCDEAECIDRHFDLELSASDDGSCNEVSLISRFMQGQR